MAIVDLEDYLLFIAFLDPYLIIGISEIKLDETLSPTELF